MTKIITVGTAVLDVLLQGDIFTPQDEDGVLVEEFKLGDKLEVEAVTYSTGGGASNGAVTFVKQGMDVSLVANIASDVAGDAVLNDMKKYKVDVSLVTFDQNVLTGYSTILVAPNGGRSVLVYRGASANMSVDNINISKIIGDWIFITSLAGNFEVIEALVDHASNNHMRIALIPGSKELEQADRLKQLLNRCHIVSANLEEMQSLYGDGSKEDIAKRAAYESQLIAVVTDGPKGVAVANGNHLCSAGMYEDIPVIDRLGAGDAFASGFTAKIAQEASLEDAITFASANSTSVVSKVGAKTGILDRDAPIHGMEINCEDYHYE